MTGSRWRFSSQNRRSLSSRALEVALVFTHSTSWSESNILIIAVQNKLTTIPEIELGDMLWSPSTGLYVRRAVFGSLNERNHESAGVGTTKSGSYSCQASRVDMNSIHSTVEEVRRPSTESGRSGWWGASQTPPPTPCGPSLVRTQKLVSPIAS